MVVAAATAYALSVRWFGTLFLLQRQPHRIRGACVPILYPFHIILQETSLTSVGRRSSRRHIANAILMWAWYIPLPHHFARNLAYVRWTALISATYCKRDSHVGLVYMKMWPSQAPQRASPIGRNRLLTAKVTKSIGTSTVSSMDRMVLGMKFYSNSI